MENNSTETEAAKQERLEGERRRRLIAAAMLTGIYGQTPERTQKMQGLITAFDVKIKEEQYDALIDMMAKGQVGRNQGQEVISMVVRPVDQFGVTDIFARLNTVAQQYGGAIKVRRMKGILGNFSDTGFDRYMETNASSVATFLNRFPDAMSFDIEADRFLRSINNPNNSPQTVGEYYEAMTDFKNLMYGEEQRFVDQYKIMEQQAVRRKEELERQRGELVSTYAEKQLTKMTVKKYRGEIIKAQLYKDGEEVDPHYKHKMINLSDEVEDNEDVILSLPEQGLFAIFDGAGRTGNGREASRAARGALMKLQLWTMTSAVQFAMAMEQINAEVIKTGGMSTALIAKVNKSAEGREYLSFASVGDSRLYLLKKTGEITQMTQDEGEGNVAWNILGMGKKDMKQVRSTVGVANTEQICLQFQDVWLNDGDRVIMCSDGITGDDAPDEEKGKKGDIMPIEQVKELASTRTTELAAENLLLAAREIDDRTVIVFDV